MTVGHRGIAVVLVVAIAGCLLSLVTVGLRLTQPSTGTAIAASGSAFEADGVGVTILPGAATVLREGDVVTAIKGRAMTSWAEDWLDGGAALPVDGGTVSVEVRRDGAPVTLDVPLRPYPLDVLGISVGTLGFVLAMLAIGVGVFAIRPQVPAAGALLLAGVGAAGSTFPFLLGQDPLDLTRGMFAFGLLTTGVIYLLLWAGVIDFVLVFPRPVGPLVRRPMRRLIPYAALAAGYLAAIAVAGLTAPTTLAWLGAWGPISLLPSIATFFVAPVVLTIRWRTGPREDRAVLRGFALVMGFIVVADLAIWVIPEALGGRPLVPWSIAGIVGLPFPILVATAIVRHRAFDIDVVVRRSLVYGGLTLAIVGTYAATAAVLGAALGSSSAFATSLLSTGVAALVALPVRDILQRGVTRLLFGDREEPVRAIRRLGKRLELSVDPATMPRTVVDTVADALRLPYVGLELGTGDDARLIAERGTAPEGLTARLLTFQGRPMGRLLVAARGPSDPLTATDLQLLDDLCRQVGVAAHAALLTEDLRASRERLITAREEERRRLRRDLHDGLGPSLAGIGMRAGAAEELVRRDPEAAARVLAELQAEASAAVTEIRRLVDGLRPPAIDEVGLVGALRLAADRLDAPGAPDVSVEAAGPLPALPAAVEVAAYRIGTEALTNAVRHAAAARCSIQLISGEDLMVVVEDDGRGLPGEPRAGLGLASMHERAAELGGECRIEPRPGGGTRVIARLPLTIVPAVPPAS
jgi:signal transduction histidine kinase